MQTAQPLSERFFVQSCGSGWQGPAWRAGLLFLLAYSLPGAWGLALPSALSALVMLCCYAWLVLAIYRFLGRGAISAQPAELVVALHDEAALPATLDDVLSLDLQPDTKPREWSLDLLHALEWKRMGDLCLAFYQLRELSGRNVTVGADGSMDALLHQPGEEAAFALLYCKARGEKEVGIDAVEALSSQMTELGVSRAFFMGVWSFSKQAKELAQARQITLVDDRMFLALLGRLPHDESQRLLNLAVEGDYTSPSCPGCLLKMIPRQNESGRYWGCRAYPNCKHTLGMLA